MTPYALFLADCEDESRRSQLWKIFEEGRRWLVEFEGESRFIEIVGVRSASGNNWNPCPSQTGACINVDVTKEDGPLLHEMFHSMYHLSVFHDGKSDERWGDAFCDAFRFFASRKLGLQEKWVTKIAGYAPLPFQEIMNGSSDTTHDKKYGYPASRIVKAVGFEHWEAFPKYWNQLWQRKRKPHWPTLNAEFAYDIEHGTPIQ